MITRLVRSSCLWHFDKRMKESDDSKNVVNKNLVGQMLPEISKNLISQQCREIVPTPCGSILHHTNPPQVPYIVQNRFFMDTGHI